MVLRRQSTTARSARPRAKGVVRLAGAERSHPAVATTRMTAAGRSLLASWPVGSGRCHRESNSAGVPPASSCMTTAQPGRTSSPPRQAGRLLAWQRHNEAGAAARTKAVVARQDAHAWLRRDRARAPSSLDRQPEQARARSCVGTDRTDDRRDPDHRAVASPRGAVISSAPARALLRFVRRRSDRPSRSGAPGVYRSHTAEGRCWRRAAVSKRTSANLRWGSSPTPCRSSPARPIRKARVPRMGDRWLPH